MLWHGALALMAWCIGNAKIEPRGNAILITKQVSGSAKIDPLLALIDAVSLMMLNPASARLLAGDPVLRSDGA
jgi:phage terminase large subunit-like protein